MPVEKIASLCALAGDAAGPVLSRAVGRLYASACLKLASSPDVAVASASRAFCERVVRLVGAAPSPDALDVDSILSPSPLQPSAAANNFAHVALAFARALF
jgi:hypothetical protein